MHIYRIDASPDDRHRAENRVTQADFQMIADAAR